MLKKDYVYAAVVGFITAFFASVILINSEISLAWGAFSLPLWALFIILPIGEYIGYFVASKLFSHVTVLRQLGRFGIVGLMNFSVDTGVVLQLRAWTDIPVDDKRMIALFIAGASVAIVNSYFWQRLWTFSEKAPPTTKEFIAFVVVTLLGLGINTAVSYLGVLVLKPLGILTESRLLVLAKVGATAVSLFWNFLGYKFIVFK